MSQMFKTEADVMRAAAGNVDDTNTSVQGELKRLQRKVVAIETCPFKSKEERVLYNLSCICTYPCGLHKELMELHNLLICLCHYLFSPKPVEPKPPSPLAVCESS